MKGAPVGSRPSMGSNPVATSCLEPVPGLSYRGSGVSFLFVAAALTGSHSEPADSDPGPPALRLFSREVGRQPADEFADILGLDEYVSRPDDLSHETFAPQDGRLQGTELVD